MSTFAAITSIIMPWKDESPYKSHPIYHLRRGLLFISVAGLVLSICVMDVFIRYGGGLSMAAPFLFFFSILLVQADFADWRHHNRVACQQCSQRPMGNSDYGTGVAASDNTANERAPLLPRSSTGYDTPIRANYAASDPDFQWPRKSFMIYDLILGVVSLFVYWGEVIVFSSYPYSYNSGSSLFQAYISLCTLVAGLIHLKSWWIAFMARRKQKWAEEERSAIAHDNRIDIEAGQRHCHCANEQEISQTKNEDSRILNRVVAFLRKNGSTMSEQERDGSPAKQTEASQSDDVNSKLTPQSSSSDSSTEPDLEAQGMLHTSPGEASWAEDCKQDAVLVTKKAKSKKGKEKV